MPTLGALTTLRFATYLAPRNEELYRFVAAEVGRRLGVATELAVGGSYDELAAGVHDAAFVCGLPYVRVVARAPGAMVPVAAPVLAGARYAGRPVYFSDVVTRAGSGVRAFADLGGRRWAYNEPSSLSGVGVVAHRLALLGATWAFFGEIVEAGFHQKALRLVADGSVDAAAIDSHVLELVARDDPALHDSLDVVDVLGPSTIQPLVAGGHLPEALVEDIRAAVVALEGDVLAAHLVERFVAVDDADYDDVRAMASAAATVGAIDAGNAPSV